MRHMSALSQSELLADQASKSQYAPTKAADPTHSASPPKLPPLGQFIQPEEVADLAAFVLGPSGCSTTSQRLITCAGASL
jgi:NAD(P)-dependent dehydrogenase (short-subunit alcohol dehydrogenase family)